MSDLLTRLFLINSPLRSLIYFKQLGYAGLCLNAKTIEGFGS
jgi:hypothetical protein